jgi:hypothetical protein
VNESIKEYFVGQSAGYGGGAMAGGACCSNQLGWYIFKQSKHHAVLNDYPASRRYIHIYAGQYRNR